MLNQQSTIFISGASDGIGKAMALEIARRTPCKLALCGRNEDKLKNVLKEIHTINPDVKVVMAAFDASDITACQQFADHVLKEFNQIDILVNNAGANTQKARVEEIDLQELQYMFSLNCVAHLAFIQKFLPKMKENKNGFIMNILSSCCLFNNPTLASYTATKKAMEAISKILVKEVKDYNIKVSSIYPGGVDTNFRTIERPDYLDVNKLAKVFVDTMELEDGVIHDLVLRPMVENNF